mgnify:CR=1 FL=1
MNEENKTPQKEPHTEEVQLGNTSQVFISEENSHKEKTIEILDPSNLHNEKQVIDSIDLCGQEVCKETERLHREIKLTDKGSDFKMSIIARDERAFFKAYEQWKKTARLIRTNLKTNCSEEEINIMQNEVLEKSEVVSHHYSCLVRNEAASKEIVNKKDTCDILTADIVDLLKKRMSLSTFNECIEKERVRSILNKMENKSVFGETNTETINISTLYDEPADKKAHR